MNNVDGAALHQSVPAGVLYLMVLLQHCYPRMVFAQLVIGCCKKGACCHQSVLDKETTVLTLYWGETGDWVMFGN